MRSIGVRGGEGSTCSAGILLLRGSAEDGGCVAVGRAGSATTSGVGLSGVFAAIAAISWLVAATRQQSSVLPGWLHSDMSPWQQAMAAGL